MGANFLILASSVLLQPLIQQDTIDRSDHPSHGIAFERLSDVLQYNRVQGLSFGLGYQARIPGTRSTGVYATVRYGLSDERITGRLTLLHEPRDQSLAVSGYYDVVDVDPFSPGRTLGNTLNGLFAGHDNADYMLARGGSAKWETWIGTGLDLIIAARIERQGSVRRVAKSAVNDFLGGSGLFPSNPPVGQGTFGGGSVSLGGFGRTRWNLTLDLLGGTGQTTARLFGDARRSLGAGPGITLRIKAGAATEPVMPQMAFRLGGLNTIRGFEYGIRRGPTFWATQLDVALVGGRVRPVIFLDAGQAASLSDLTSSTALVGGGAGLSLFSGLVRFDLSHPISPDGGGKLRFDIVIQAAR